MCPESSIGHLETTCETSAPDVAAHASSQEKPWGSGGHLNRGSRQVAIATHPEAFGWLSAHRVRCGSSLHAPLTHCLWSSRRTPTWLFSSRPKTLTSRGLSSPPAPLRLPLIDEPLSVKRQAAEGADRMRTRYTTDRRTQSGAGMSILGRAAAGCLPLGRHPAPPQGTVGLGLRQRRTP
jgi:hypothetical protein